MKVLHAIQSADPVGGGPIEVILQLAAAGDGHSNHCVVSLDAPDAAFLRDFPAPIHALGPAGLLGYSPRLIPWLRQHAHEYRAVVVHGLWRYISVGSWRALRDMGVPYFVFPHGMLDPWFKQRYPVKHMKKSFFWPWTEYRLLRDARAVVFTCEDEMQRANRSFAPYQCNPEIVVLGIHRPPTDADRQREAFFTAFPELRGKRMLLFLSRIHPKKGCDQLIQAFSRIVSRDLNVQLVIAGPDQTGWVAKLKSDATVAGVGNRVTWTGMINGDVKWGAYRAAEAFVLPTHHENFGIVVAEALACGLPVLISDQVQIWREIDASRAGYVEPDDLPGTQRLLERWLSTPEGEWAEIGRRAVECYEQKFQVGGYATRFMELVDAYSASAPRTCGKAA
jgi:glycosyltransferase involved in cell wall biosynthesis